ncbi:MAG: oligosaccharide flippase family protein [Rhodobacteraceae bacterium]|nr:oligosaccharide flippase family protein [Paracoccaceae bacterium]MCP5342489.1 oligosaccharide flippase family protein [Paracoccaceae bacterium]
MLKKAFMLVSGNAFGSALLLARNLIVARLISPEDYGIASTFAISMSIVEMLSNFGLNQMIVVDKDGDDPRVQSGLQGFQVLRGLTSSLLLWAISGAYARFLGIADLAWAYQVIAFIPLVNGLQHFDVHRLKRHLKFTPSILSLSVPPLVSVLALWPLALIYDDYRIMLAALFVQAGAMVVLSHLTAERPYRVRLDLGQMRAATGFGWPLLVNGILLFGVFNGERLIVGRELGMLQLGHFSMALTLTLTPTLVLAGSCQTFFLPQLSAARERPEAFQWLGIATMESSLVIGVLLVLGVSLVGAPVVDLLLGQKYATMIPILVPITVLQAVRVAKTGGAVVALARGQSGNAMAANLFRVLSLPVSWWAVIRTGDVLVIIWIATAAEVLGYLMSVLLASRRTGLRLTPLLAPAVLTALAFATALVDAQVYAPKRHLMDQIHIAQWAVVLTSVAALLAMSGLRGYLVRRFWRRPR